MTREERQKAIDALKISSPIRAMTNKEFNDYIQTLNKVMDWLEQEPVLDKIRAKIVELTKCPYDTECLGANCPSNTDCMICGDHVLEIIDKYKAESEDKE